MTDNHLYEKTLSEEQIFDGIVVKLYRDRVELEDGKKAVREVIKHPGGVCILPVDGEGNIYMVKQFRYPFKAVLLEVPAGKKETGEEPMDCGIRELGEEIGAVAEKVTYIGKMWMWLKCRLKRHTAWFCGMRFRMRKRSLPSLGQSIFLIRESEIKPV